MPRYQPLPDATPASTPAVHLAYRPDIDGMRALAVLAVVLYHAFPSALRGGFAGVDIFFVISGFLITSILLDELRRGSFTVAGFYARRVQRIFPALILVMLACAAFGWCALFPDEFRMLGKHIFGGAAFVSNIFLWNEVGYFDTAAETKPLLHLWSLAIEEQFYIFWPPLLLLAARRRIGVVRMALALAVLSFAVNVAGVHRYPSATFYSPAGRVWELLAGALLAGAASGQLRLFAGTRSGPDGVVRMLDFGAPRARNLWSVLGLALVLLAYGLIGTGRAFPGWWALLPVLGAVLLIAAGPQAWVNRMVLSRKPLVWVGLISYPLYLWHWPLLSFAAIVESGQPSARVRALALLAAVLLAWLTWRLLERPLRGWSTPRARVLLLSLLMAALAGGAVALYRLDGLPARASIVENAKQQQSLKVVEDVANAAACKQRYGFDTLYKYCLQTWPERAPTVALVGDSHAYHVVAGLTNYYKARGENLVMFGTRIPFWGIDPASGDEYQAVTQHMLELALQTPSIHTVLFSTFATQSANNLLRQNTLRETLRRFTASGKTIIWLNDVPELDFQPRACIRRGLVASSGTRRDCSIARADYDAHIAEHDKIFQAILAEFPTVRQFHPAKYLCDAQRCHVMLDGQLLYRDTNHLSYEGDLYIGARFAQEQAALEKRP